jgi:hypothetical protein
MFDKRVLLKIFMPQWGKVTRDWRKLHNEELRDRITKYNSDNQIMKDVMGEACSTCGGEERLHTGFWWGNLKQKDHLE